MPGRPDHNHALQNLLLDMSPLSQPSRPPSKALGRASSRQSAGGSGAAARHSSKLGLACASVPELRPSTAPETLPRLQRDKLAGRPEKSRSLAMSGMSMEAMRGKQVRSASQTRRRATHDGAPLAATAAWAERPGQPAVPGKVPAALGPRLRCRDGQAAGRGGSRAGLPPQTLGQGGCSAASSSSATARGAQRPADERREQRLGGQRARAATVAAAAQGTSAREVANLGKETSAALKEISCVAANVATDLEKLVQGCGTDRDGYADDLTSLQEISVVTRTVQNDLRNFEGTRLMSDMGSGVNEINGAYDDPLLARARRIAAFTNRLCDDINSRSCNFGMATRTAIEVSSLQQISTVTQKVCEDMRRLQGESWAAKVLKNVEDEEAVALFRTSGTGGLGGIAPDSTSVRGDEESEDGGLVSPMPSNATGTGVGITGRGSMIVGSRPSKLEGLPDLQEFLAEQDSDELSPAELQRLQLAFKRFKVPDSNDLHTADVQGLLQYLGHVMTDEEIVEPIIKDVTSYDYLDFDEFLSFMERFIPREREQFHNIFEKYDEDQSGEISVMELKKMLCDLGFIPLRAMMSEALAVADKSGNGQLDYDEFVTFLAVYRRFEGFSTSEIGELGRIFDQYSLKGDVPGKLLPADNLGDALVQVFGLHVSEFAETLAEQLKSGQGLQKSSYSAAGSSGRSETLTFQEFLIFARKTREASLVRLKETYPTLANRKALGANVANATTAVEEAHEATFAAHDKDGSGGISEEELRAALVSMGYTPLQQNLDEILAEVDKDRNRELDFSEFFDFLLIFRQREGFRKHHVEEMRKLFERFDDDGSGEISAMELADLFRELGYSATLEEVYVFVTQVDANGTNALDFREYLRLMRLHREEELRKMSQMFDKFKGHRSTVPSSILKTALEALGEDVPPGTLPEKKKDIDFDSFVYYADTCRAERVAKEKKKAGFSDEKIAHFQDLFTRFDKDRSGEIDTIELLGILREFDWEPKSREEQQALVRKLDTARAKARDAGVEGVSMDGSAAINFWTFVQLSRILETEHDKAEEERMNNLMAELRFSQKEVEEFRHIFHEKKKAIAAEHPDDDSYSKGLPRQAIRRLIFMLGVELKGEKKRLLDDQLEELGCSEGGLLEFPGFLRLMRWLMETGWLPE